MKKFVSTLARKLSVFLAMLFVAATIAPAALAVPKRPENQYVLDSADVLSSGTEQHIIEKNKELFDQYGAEIVVVAVDFLGGKDIEDYTYEMFNDWGVGSEERNNGILLVLAIGEEDYYAQAGYGIDDYFDGGLLGDILYDYLEDDFAAEDYDAGVRKVFGALADEVEGYYAGGAQADIQPEGWDDDYDYYDDYDPLFSRWSIGHFVSMILSFIFKVIVILLVVWVFVGFFSSWFGGGGRGSGGGGGGGFWRGMMLGSMMNRRRNYWGGFYGPPPPPPGPGPGPRPGSRPSGFGSPPRGGFGGFGGSGHSGGFHGGGSSHRGGAGRSGGFGGGGHSGGGFHGGGGSHGGGAGRR